MLAHHPFMYTSYAAEAKEQGLIDKANVDRYKQFAATHISNVTKFLNSRVMSNPPPKAVSAYFSGSFDTAIDGDIAEIEFSEWEDPDKKMFYNAQLRMRDPVHGVKVTLFLSSGKFIIYFGKDSNRIEGDLHSTTPPWTSTDEWETSCPTSLPAWTMRVHLSRTSW